MMKHTTMSRFQEMVTTTMDWTIMLSLFCWQTDCISAKLQHITRSLSKLVIFATYWKSKSKVDAISSDEEEKTAFWKQTHFSWSTKR